MCFATVLNPTATELKELIAYSSVPILVAMGADWCPPYQMLRPFLRKIAIDLGADAHIAVIDVDVNRQLRLDWQVTSIPQILVFRHGTLAGRLDGFKGYAALRASMAAFVEMNHDSPEEAIFAAAVELAATEFDVAPRPADDTFRHLWHALAPARDRYAAAQQAEVARGTISAEDCRRRLRAEEDRLITPLQPQLAAAMAEAKSLRLDFADTVEEAVEIYAAAALCRIAGRRQASRPSA